MFCYIALINIKNNIDTWERLLLIKNRLNNLSVAEKRLLDNYNVSNIEEYINLIKSNINDEESMSNIISKYPAEVLLICSPPRKFVLRATLSNCRIKALSKPCAASLIF